METDIDLVLRELRITLFRTNFEVSEVSRTTRIVVSTELNFAMCVRLMYGAQTATALVSMEEMYIDHNIADDTVVLRFRAATASCH